MSVVSGSCPRRRAGGGTGPISAGTATCWPSHASRFLASARHLGLRLLALSCARFFRQIAGTLALFGVCLPNIPFRTFAECSPAPYQVLSWHEFDRPACRFHDLAVICPGLLA